MTSPSRYLTTEWFFVPVPLDKGRFVFVHLSLLFNFVSVQLGGATT